MLRGLHSFSLFYPILPDDRACQEGGRGLFAVDYIVGERRIVKLVEHDHLDRMVLGHVVADPDALRAALTPVDRDIGGSVLEPFLFPRLVVIQDGVGLGAELSAELTARGRANLIVDISYKIH